MNRTREGRQAWAGFDCSTSLFGRPLRTTEQLFRREADVFGDLPQKRWSDVLPGVEGDRRSTAIWVAVLPVGAPLPLLLEPEALKE